MAKRGSMLRATIHGLSAYSVERAGRRAQSVDSGNLWIELNETCIRRSYGSFTKGARSRYSRAVLAVHERLKHVALRARVHIGPETGSMWCTCINSLHNVSGELQS